MEKINKEDIEKFYKFLNHLEETEIRVCDPDKIKDPIPIFCKNISEFIEGCEKWNGIRNIYAGMNERISGGKSDKDVKFITNVGHDIDAHKTGRIDIASQVALQIKDDCIKQGYKEPMIICSGWGFWVIHHISPIENTPENERKIKEFGDRTIQRYSREEIEIDSKVYNPSRISRVAGTLNLREKQNPIKSFIANNPSNEEDTKLADDILAIEIKTAFSTILTTTSKGNCAFMDYCLTHEIPKGERHSIISRNMSLYICDNPDRELLKQQYSKIQKGSDTELDQWLKNADENGKDKYPFSCGELINFQKKYKISLKCKGCPKFKDFLKSKKEEEKSKEINIIEESIVLSEVQKTILKNLALKDRNNATETIVKEIEKNHHIYTIKNDEKPEVWIYDNGIYKPEGISFIKEIVRKILEETFTSQICNEIINKIEADTYVNSDEFFNINYPEEVPIKNGILNIITKELKPFDPKKIFFNKLPVTYDPSANCLAIEKHLKDVLKFEEDIKVIYEIIGFALYKDYFLEKMFMFVGDGRNGKGKTIDLIRRFLGVENCSSVPLASLCVDNFSVSELFGKLVNLAGDLSNTALKETGMLKQTTGRDLIGAKRKFLTDIKFVNYAKHIFACNDLPKVYDMSKGFWSRWVVLEFPYEFIQEREYNSLSEEKRTMKKILDPYHIDKISSDAELSGLLNKALEGLERIRKHKIFSYTKGTEEIQTFWIRKSDSFVAFCFDHLEEEPISEITKADLRKAYHLYCKEHRLKGCSDRAMAITLQEIFGVMDNQRMLNGLMFRSWEGIKFKDYSKYDPNKDKIHT